MHDPVAAGDGLVDRGRVRHVADHHVVGDKVVRLEGAAHLGGVAYQKPHLSDRTRRVRARCASR